MKSYVNAWSSVLFRAPVALLVAALLLGIGYSPSIAQDAAPSADAGRENGGGVPIVRTDSPRATINSFMLLHNMAEAAVSRYLEQETEADFQLISLLSQQFRALVDYSQVPLADRRDVGQITTAYLLDIFSRIAPPPLDTIPDEDDFTEDQAGLYHIPATPLRIREISEGERAGEFMFEARTPAVAARFAQAIADQPLQPGFKFANWLDILPQLTGPLIPAGFSAAMPHSLLTLWLGTPVWKILAFGLLVFVACLVGYAIYKWTRAGGDASRLNTLGRRLVLPVAILLMIWTGAPFVQQQLILYGEFSKLVTQGSFLISYILAAWIFWLLAALIFEWLIRSPKIKDESLDANLLRLLAGFLGAIGALVLLGIGAQKLGLPVVSIVAGLGIGGLAVALAIRPTLENLIGGFILYLDKPVRVGDFCSFGTRTGTVEKIGVRSTQVRALDRTLVSIPNAQFADMELINWAECDMILIDDTIGVRYETDPEQLRYLLAELRKMLHAHPRIDRETVRVRFVGYGDSALNIQVRVYALTREWNDFFAIREDVFLRIYDIVKEAGSGFAFPSQTVYLGRDDGLDTERSDASRAKVRNWRHRGILPFPRLTRDEIDKLDGTLDYPPRGSPEAGREMADMIAEPERLSAMTGEQDEHADNAREEHEKPAGKT
jgi:MscS family membrane protein